MTPEFLSVLRPMTLALRKLLSFAAAFAMTATIGQAAEIPANSAGHETLVKPFLAQHCVKCHNADKQSGDLRLDSLVVDFSSPKIMGHWEEIMNRMNSGEMPPKREPRPKPADIAGVAQWIAGQLHEAEAVRQSSGGERISFRKLSREEYTNSIRDLLGVTFDVNGPTGLPEDPDWKGFERIGSVLSLSPAHVEKHLAAAEVVLGEALALRPEPQRELIRWTALDMRYGRKARPEFEARGIADQVRLELIPNNHVSDTWPLEIQASGDYRLRIKLSGLRPAGGPAPRLKVYLSNIDKTVLERDVDAAEDQPITLETRVHLAAGKYPVRLANAVSGPDPGARRSRNGPGGSVFTNLRNRAPWQLKLSNDDYQPIEPTLIIDSVEWEGPLLDSWPPAAHRQIFFAGDAAQKDTAYAGQILTRFAERAWRRPVTDDEITRLLKPVETSLALGDSFELSVKQGLVAVLCAKGFLYLEEGRAEQRGQLADWELAARLSYFLWSAPPDGRLLELAGAGKLQDPATRLAETRRMLADPKSAAFARSFPRQWLQLRRVGMFAPDKALYPEYDDNLEQSMVAETVGFFEEVLRTGGSIRDFLDSNWTMLNERLALHYGIEGVRGDQLRRVALLPEQHRGGLLTHASILSLTSDGTRHRPVHRGVWVLESIVGKPPPPPPANVPALSTPAPDQQKLSVRQKLELHRSDPNCTACHSKIDPLGIAFDNYDAIGRWRTVETLKDGTGADPTLDPSGRLPDGRTFQDSQELRKLLLADSDKFAAAFSEKLATYALRRGLTFADRESLRPVAQQAQQQEYRLVALIEGLVTSPLFSKR